MGISLINFLVIATIWCLVSIIFGLCLDFWRGGEAKWRKSIVSGFIPLGLSVAYFALFEGWLPAFPKIDILLILVISFFGALAAQCALVIKANWKK